jgi:hypothetical protein
MTAWVIVVGSTAIAAPRAIAKSSGTCTGIDDVVRSWLATVLSSGDVPIK